MLASVRKLSIAFLSIFLIYAGVAWALETCPRHEGHSYHSTPEDGFEFQVGHGQHHSQGRSPPVVHCSPVTHQVILAARIASAEILRSDKTVPLEINFLPYPAASATLKSDLWLEAVFKRIVAVSLPRDFARHLFLSILQI